MDALSRAGTWVATALGRESLPVRLLRPAFEAALDASTLWHGVAWSVNGEPIRIDPRVRRWVPRVTEPEVFALLQGSIAPGEVVLDVGAFLGIYAVLEARWAGERGRVVAFEPTPRSARLAERHLRLNGVRERATVVAAAVGSTVGVADLTVHDDAFVNRIGVPHPGRAARGTVRVSVTTVDAYCAMHGLEPDWIRVDVQGHEVEVLHGARETIARRGSRLRIVVEMHPSLWPSCGLSREAVAAALAGLGLDVQPVAPGADPFAPDGHALLIPR